MLHESPKYTVNTYCIFPVDFWSVYMFCYDGGNGQGLFPEKHLSFTPF